MSHAEQSIEQALAEDPSREELWLLYADHLQVQGDPRGEFIALEQAKLQNPERKETLLQAQRDLVTAHDARWRGALQGIPNLELTWKNGFILEVDLEKRVDRTLEILRELSSTRFLQKLVIRGMDPARPTPQLWALVRLLEARHIKELDLSHNAIGVRGMKAFVTAEALSQLRSLNLCHCEMGIGWLPGFCGVSWSNLQSLDLSQNLIAERLMRLDAPTTFQTLRELRLSRAGLTDRALLDFAERFDLRELRALDLSDNPLSAQAHEALLKKSAWPQLRELDASQLVLQSDELAQLISAAGGLGVHTLRIGGSYRAPHAVEALPHSLSGPTHRLELVNTTLLEAHIDTLANIPWIEPLESIWVRLMQPQASEALEQHPQLKRKIKRFPSPW